MQLRRQRGGLDDTVAEGVEIGRRAAERVRLPDRAMGLGVDALQAPVTVRGEDHDVLAGDRDVAAFDGEPDVGPLARAQVDVHELAVLERDPEVLSVAGQPEIVRR